MSQQNINDQTKGNTPSYPSSDSAVQYGAINPNSNPNQQLAQPSNNSNAPYYQPIVQQQEGTYTANQPFYNAQPVIYTQPVTYQQSTYPSHNITTNTSTALLSNYDTKEENDSKILLIIGIFVGIVWLVCFFKYKNSSNPRARAYAKTAGILFIVQFILSIALAIGLIVSMSF